nr:von Willebrand factor type A domain-containing protein [Flavobacterium sp. NRK1]
MTVGLFVLNTDNNNTIVAPTVTPQNNVTVIDTQKVKEAFDPAKAEPKEKVVDAVKPQKTIPDFNETKSTSKDSVYFIKGQRFETSKDSSNSLAKGYAATGTKEKVQPIASTALPTSESKKITGVITDSQGLPVPGVTVMIEGTSKSVSTDFDGKYMIDAKEGEKLIASFVGMEQMAVTLGKQKNVNLQLKDNAMMLEDVVVEAYRTTTRATSNVAVTTISSADARRQSRLEKKKAKNDAIASAKVSSTTQPINNPSASYVSNDKHVTTLASKTIDGRPNANFIQTLQGQVPGLNIATGSGQPGANSTVILRGIGSINGNAEPLYVVNGVPLSSAIFKQINTNDIESISVIKDAGATSIYGNRGRNGVIIVKTKKALSKKELRKLARLNKKLEQQKKKHPEMIHFTEPSKPHPIEVDQEEYENFVENQFENPATTPLSTFSIDVDNASYTNIRRFINNGQTVPKDAVRVEEMINFFKYQYPQPVKNEPFSINTEYSDAPWNQQHKLLKIGLQGKIIPDDNLPASNFVFLIDVSGSMNDQNKLPLLKQSMKLLVNQMRKKDKIAIVVYAGAAGLVLPSTSGDEKEKIYAALDNLSAGGSTAGGAGIELAYKTAEENFAKGGNNRVILATDGDFNVGASSNTDMQTLIEAKRKSGVFLTCLGYGMGNYKDSKLETLADKGNGNYAYIDTMQEADRYLNKEFKGSMYAIAKDVKIQIEFNPKHVQSYRLIGYENRKLRDEDFANDAIDAGELGSGHTVTALYEIIPVGVKSDYFTAAPDLKYSQPTATGNQFNDELATIKFRSKKPDEDKSTEIVKVIPNTPLAIQNTSADYKFSAAVAWFGLKLRDSKLIPNKKTDDIKALAKQGLQNDPDGYRAEFIRLVEMVK